jgi:hypothetical protein
LPSEKGLKYHQPFCKKNQFKTPKSLDVYSPDVHSPDVHSSDVHSPDVHSSDVHSPDVHSPDVHSSDVHSPDVHFLDVQSPNVHSSNVLSPNVHSPIVQCPFCQENVLSIELSNHINERHFHQISREGMKCESCSLFFLNEAEISKHKSNCNHSSIIHHSPFIQIHQDERHHKSNSKVENGKVKNLDVNGDLIDEEEDETTTLMNGE